MPDKIPLRTINQQTYPHAGRLEIDNINGVLRLLIDERGMDDDAMIRERCADTSISFTDAVADPEIGEAAQRVYADLRLIAITMLQRWVGGQNV
jgi:hypothetical protein